LLAIKTELANKEEKTTLIFDEIDAHIGGETATCVGQMLNKLGGSHQILCITHFPQVAKHAHHHHAIAKKELDGRTIASIYSLDSSSREEELSRMKG